MDKYDHDTEAMDLKLKFKYNQFYDLQAFRESLEDKVGVLESYTS